MKGNSSRCVDSFHDSVHLIAYMRSECCEVERSRGVAVRQKLRVEYPL